jgi:hypothetical protein
MSQFNIAGIVKFEIGDASESGGISNLKSYFGIKRGSFSVSFEETSTSIYVEEAATKYIGATGNNIKSFELELLGLDLADLPVFMGGETTNDIYTAPISATVLKSTMFTTYNRDGVTRDWFFPLCLVKSIVRGALSGNSEAVGLRLIIDVLQPRGAGLAAPMKVGEKTLYTNFEGDTYTNFEGEEYFTY